MFVRVKFKVSHELNLSWAELEKYRTFLLNGNNVYRTQEAIGMYKTLLKISYLYFPPFYLSKKNINYLFFNGNGVYRICFLLILNHIPLIVLNKNRLSTSNSTHFLEFVEIFFLKKSLLIKIGKFQEHLFNSVDTNTKKLPIHYDIFQSIPERVFIFIFYLQTKKSKTCTLKNIYILLNRRNFLLKLKTIINNKYRKTNIFQQLIKSIYIDQSFSLIR